MSGTDIFLSYARHDRATARHFADSFVEEGFTVWWDASLHSGETFDEVIEQKLRDARAVVVLWSPRSVASRWVRAEATLADRRNKLAPAIIEACDRPIVFELTHAAELSDWKGDRSDPRWRDFMDDLRRLVDSAEDRERAAQEKAAQAKAPQPPATQPEPVAPPAPVAARPQPVERTEAPAAASASGSRWPIRPGSDDVIYAGLPGRNLLNPRPRGSESPIPLQPAETVAEVHCLEIEGEEIDDDVFIIPAGGARIGRTSPADIILSHGSISREHCIIGIANDELLVTDLNSTNGTFIDEHRITRATILPVGSVVRLGQVTLRHSVHSPGEAARLAGLSGGDSFDDPYPARIPAMR